MPLLSDFDIETDVLYLRGFKKGFEKGFKKGFEESRRTSIPIIKHWQKGIKPSMIATMLNLPIKKVEHIITQFQAL